MPLGCLGFPLWFLGLDLLGVLSALVFQGYQGALGFPSFLQVQGNLGLLCLPCGQGNLEIHSVLGFQELQADQ